MTAYDVAIVGGGCVGLSVATHLADRADLSLCVLEKEHHLAQHQSGRNSGVLHPGFNYPPGSRKARLATEGTDRMKAYCAANDIPCDELGVLVIATDEAEVARLDDIEARADANGVATERLDSPAAIHEHEPHAAGQAGIYCPEAASIDSQQYVYALARDVERQAVDLHRGTEVQRIDRTETSSRLETTRGPITADYVVNAAGLYADRLAHQLDVGRNYQLVPFRGEYYELVPGRRHLVNTMLYPTPDPALPFLGVHYTRRTDGSVIVGPNAVLAFGREAYHNTQFDLRELASMLGYAGFWRLLASRKMLGVAAAELGKSYRKASFVEAARRLLPGVSAADFVRSYAGIRAQLVSAAGELVMEPLVEHGPRSTHVLNAVSPGLTTSLPFGEHVTEQVLERR